MKLKWFVTVVMVLSPALVLSQAPVSEGDDNTGAEIYQQHCALCHENPEETKAPVLDSLRRMGPRAVSYALTNGKMKVQAAALSTGQVNRVVDYLSAAVVEDNAWVATHTCAAPRATVDSGAAIIDGVGLGLRNHRNMSAGQAGLTLGDMRELQLAWAMGFPQTANMRAQPAVIGNTLFISVADSGQLFALDLAETPCVKWMYQHAVPLRTAINVGVVDGRDVLVFGDASAHVQLADASSGELLWRTDVKVTSVANITAMPVLYDGRIYVPVSTGELNMAGVPEYECCTSHGAVVALDAVTGAEVWTYHTMENATPRGVSRVGTPRWGPAGAPIWTTAAIDEARGLLYVGTGEDNTEPTTDVSDAVLAINLADGTLRWKFQASANDIYIGGCSRDPSGPNCPPAYSINKDWDFGAAIILATDSSGGDVVLAGQKSGVLWALDADTGTLRWSTQLSSGGALGGIHWGMAFDGQYIYAPTNMGGDDNDPLGRGPGLHAVDVDNGAIRWSFFPEPDCAGERATRVPSCNRNWGLSSSALVVDGAVIQGSNDGFVRIFNGDSGELLFSYDTAREFDTVNGIPAKGGSIDNASIIAANGMVLVQSGYGLLGIPGNVLLAFVPRK
ncbi:MAG: PQQ-binding-like beta-propeller repeat protein [Pseudomonadales bacterium]|jgi:polyvinyl alcohol dehydrogenase (cytochrome)|nr:PQQ-binding-like beta-propeller repeat protein [Pseudomonadales bacterium]